MNYSLADVFAWKFRKLLESGKFEHGMIAVHERDTELREILRGLPVVGRSDESIDGAPPLNVIFGCLKDTPSTHAMWINPCLPLVPVRVYRGAVDAFQDLGLSSATSVQEARNWFFDRDGVPVTSGNPAVVSTQHIAPLLSCLHAFHIFDVKRMLETGTYWSGETGDPTPMIVNTDEHMKMDVDTEFDFEQLDGYLTRHEITFDQLTRGLENG
jgi:hypothetical protein